MTNRMPKVNTHLDRLPNDVIEVIYQKETRLRMVDVLEELLPAVEDWYYTCLNRRKSIFDKLLTFAEDGDFKLMDSTFWAHYWQRRCLDERRLFLVYIQQFERAGLLRRSK